MLRAVVCYYGRNGALKQVASVLVPAASPSLTSLFDYSKHCSSCAAADPVSTPLESPILESSLESPAPYSAPYATRPPLTCKLTRQRATEALVAIIQRARQRRLYPNQITSLLRTHYDMAHTHLLVMSQQQLADLVWATGRLVTIPVETKDNTTHIQNHSTTSGGLTAARVPPPSPTNTSDHPLHHATTSLQTAALHMFPVARTFGTGGRRAEQLAKLLLGVVDSGCALDDGTTAMLHSYTCQLLPCSKGRALADVLTVWEQRPELEPAEGFGLHTERVACIVKRMQQGRQVSGGLGPRELVRVLRYWVQHVGKVPERVDVEAYGAVMTGCLMHMHVADVANMVDAWKTLGGWPSTLDWDMCVAVLRAHDHPGSTGINNT